MKRTDRSFLIDVLFFVLLLILLYFPYFSHLETLPVRVWDEAKRGVMAYEMTQTTNPLVMTYEWEPDFITTKPPLLIWIQALFIRLLGMNELAIRLPVAIMALLTSLTLFFFLRRFTGKYWLGWMAALILVTAQGYVSMHGSRSGDFDVPVTFFLVLYAFSYLWFLEKHRPKYLYVTYVFITLAVLTKGIIGFTFLPALLIYTLLKRKLPMVLRSRHFYSGILIVLLFVAGYYGLREYYTPGYLEAVAENELGGRFLEAQWRHSGGFWFYFKALRDNQFTYWLWFAVPGAVLGLFYRERRIRDLNLFAGLIIITYFLVISISKTKIEWYSIPLFPFLAIVIATGIHFVFESLRSPALEGRLPLRKNVLPYIWVFVVFVHPYSQIVDKTFWPKDTGNAAKYYKPEYFLRNYAGDGFNPDGYTIVREFRWHRFLFYVYQLREQGYTLHVAEKEYLKPGDRVITLKPKTEKYITNNYDTEFIGGWHGIKRYRIKD